MKNKIVISAVAIVILIAATAALIVWNDRSKKDEGGAQAVSSPDEAAETTAFPMEYPDRLCGIPLTGFKADDRSFEVRYGETNYIRKLLDAADNSDNKTEYEEIGEINVNGIAVTLKGHDGLICLAVWNDNNFEYVVCTGDGVSADEMTEYIEATR